MNDFRTRISPHKQRLILRDFIKDIAAQKCADTCNINRKAVNRFYRYLRQCIFEHQQNEKLSRLLTREVEIDHSFFGAKGKRRFKLKDGKKILLKRQKFMILGFLERSLDKTHIVRTYHIKRANTDTFMPLIRIVVAQGTRIYTDKWRSFNPLQKDGYEHRSVNHRKKQFKKIDGEFNVHTGTIDNYFEQSKHRLSKFGRLHLTTLHLHLTECEFRYNHRHDFADALKKILI